MIEVVDTCFPTRVYLGLHEAEPNSRTGLGIKVTRRAAGSFVNSVRYTGSQTIHTKPLGMIYAPPTPGTETLTPPLQPWWNRVWGRLSWLLAASTPTQAAERKENENHTRTTTTTNLPRPQ